MAIKKDKSTDTTDQKKSRKAIQQQLIVELKKITNQFGQLTVKFEKSLEKDAKKLAKKISKTSKAVEPKTTEEVKEVTKVKEAAAVKEAPIATPKAKETAATKKPATPAAKPSAAKEITEKPAAKKSK